MRSGRGGVLTALVAAALLATAAPAGASSWTPSWSRDAGTELDSVALDDAGNIYVVGSTTRSSGAIVALIIRSYRPGGTPRWSRYWSPGPHTLANGEDVVVGPDGAVYVGGGVQSTFLEGGGWFIRKYGAGGALRWHRESPAWRTGGHVPTTISGIAAGPHTVVVSGHDYGCCGDVQNDGWVRAFDLSGHHVWTNPFEDPAIPARFNDAATTVAEGALGTVYVGGWVARARERDDQHLTSHDLMIQKISATGHLQWSKVIGEEAAPPKHFDRATGIAVRGNVLVVAALLDRTNFSPGAAWLFRLSFDGNVQWARDWGSDPRRAAEPGGVGLGPGGGVFVSGTSRDPTDAGRDAFLRKYSSSGRLLRSAVIGGPARLMHGTHAAADGTSAYLTGYSTDRNGIRTGGRVWRFPA